MVDPSPEPTAGSIEAARPATPDDLDAVAAVAARARVEMLAKRGGATLDRLDPNRADPSADLKAALDDPLRHLAVGTIDDAVVGMGLLEVVDAPDGRPHATIRALVVDAEARSVGVGEALFDHLIAEARRQGAVAIDGTALPGDRATKNFFETQGMVARAIIVHRTLEDR